MHTRPAFLPGLGLVATALAATALGGCATDQAAFGGPGVSEAATMAVNDTLAAQIIDPNPQYDAPLQGQGVQAAEAYERYVKGAVKKPERVSTSNVGMSGGAGGSGLGGGGGVN